MSEFDERKVEILECINLQAGRLERLEDIQRKIEKITMELVDLASGLDESLDARKLYDFPREVKDIVGRYCHIIPWLTMKNEEGKWEAMTYDGEKRWVTPDAETLFIAESLAKFAGELMDEAIRRVEQLKADGNLPKMARETQLHTVGNGDNELLDERATILSDEETAELLEKRMTKAREWAEANALMIRQMD